VIDKKKTYTSEKEKFQNGKAKKEKERKYFHE